MFCGLGEEEHTRFRKQEKEKNSTKPKVYSVGRDERVSYDITTENVFAALKPFLNKTAFYTKLLGWFSGPKTKVTWLISLKFRTNIIITYESQIAVKISCS